MSDPSNNSGWICLHRKLLEWEWYDDINATRLFIHCLLKANHKPKKWRGISIDRGQFWTSLENLTSETKLSSKQIRVALSKLIRTGEVASKGQATGHTKGRMITVFNYDSYQEKADERQATGQDRGKIGASNNNDNNDNKVMGGDKSPAPRKKFIKPTLEQVSSYCVERKNSVDPQRFVDHYDSNGWKVGKNSMKDWKASVRTWEKGEKSKSDNDPFGGHYR